MTRISFCGDVRLLTPSDVTLSQEFYDLLNQCDYNVLNFEVPVKSSDATPIDKSGPCLSQSELSPSWVEKNGWNVVSFANNHIMDYGVESFCYTSNLFNKAKKIGAGTWEEAYKVHVLCNEEGKKIGIIACGHREFGALTDKDKKDCKGSAWICNSEITRLIIGAKKEVDVLLVYAHAGVENFIQPLPEWREYYRYLIDIGCDAVIASHPHVIQGWEVYKGKPIFYSLGNLCFQKEHVVSSKPWNSSLCCILSIDNTNQVEFIVTPLFYDIKSNMICLDDSTETTILLNRTNEVLNNAEEYNDFIKKELPSLWADYQHLFSNSGYISDLFNRDSLSVIKNKLLGRKFSYTHLLNNLQNESHRWAIERIIRDKYEIKD